jgi:4-hydroxythreonine-4-phosphate dehydrogenase
MNEPKRPTIAVTLGDPAGIGPEIALRAAHDRLVLEACVPVLVGSPEALERGCEITGLDPAIPSLADATSREGGVRLHPVEAPLPPLATVCAEGGRAAALAVEAAVEMVGSGACDAIVTAPLHKEALHAAGYDDGGHTGMLRRLSGVPATAMLFRSPRLHVLLLTEHLPLREVPSALTREGIVEKVRLGISFWEHAGLGRPRVALASLNPHAGEGGLMGGEEERVMAPAVAELRGEGAAVEGPIAADTVYLRAVRGEFDLVASPYHDQGLVAVKTLAFGQSVHVTVGLPFLRASVDHGTAFDLAGSGRADWGPMRRALLEAARLAPRFRPRVRESPG